MTVKGWTQRGKRSDLFSFLGPLEVLVDCHFASRRPVTMSDDRHNLQRALKGWHAAGMSLGQQ